MNILHMLTKLSQLPNPALLRFAVEPPNNPAHHQIDRFEVFPSQLEKYFWALFNFEFVAFVVKGAQPLIVRFLP